jgi:hypothetical protein
MTWQQIVSQNLGAPPTRVLADSYPVDRIQNEAFWKNLQDDLSRHCSPWESFPLSTSVYKVMPDTPGLYMYVWSPEALQFPTDHDPLQFQKILYIGQAATSLQRRFAGEYKNIIEKVSPSLWWSKDENELRSNRLARLFSLSPTRVWFCRIKSEESLALIDNLETRLISLINPPGNQQRKLRAVGLPQPIWRS